MTDYSRFSGQFGFALLGLVFVLSPFALSIMVFLRHKLGYRVTKPFLLVSVFQTLCILAVIVNLLAYGWFRLKRDTPIGDYLRQYEMQRQQQAQTAQAAQAVQAAPEPFVSKLPPPGEDAPFPSDWVHYSPPQRIA